MRRSGRLGYCNCCCSLAEEAVAIADCRMDLQPVALVVAGKSFDSDRSAVVEIVDCHSSLWAARCTWTYCSRKPVALVVVDHQYRQEYRPANCTKMTKTRARLT